jgi:hypothetical protein
VLDNMVITFRVTELIVECVSQNWYGQSGITTRFAR